MVGEDRSTVGSGKFDAVAVDLGYDPGRRLGLCAAGLQQDPER
jgi:hypothetical protein